MAQPPTSLLVRLAPIIFVVLWATGFVGAKYGMQYAEPFTFLAYRFAITCLILFPVILYYFSPEFAKFRQLLHSLIIGILIHGMYLGGVFFAIDRGLAAGISSLFVSLQPFITALIAWLLIGERISVAKIGCFVLALCGVALVLSPKLDLAISLPGINIVTVTACSLAVVSISLGAVYQKKYVAELNLVVSTAVQFLGAGIFTAVVAVMLEAGEIVWNLQIIATMAWLVLVLSIGAVGLLMYLIRQGSSASVASLFFLVPVVSMFMAWVLFGETLSVGQIIGSAVVVASVGVASRLE